MALSNSFSLIQGPPGTGKTNTGIKLLYQFCQINRQLQILGREKTTVLFCAPSNGAVDHVAKLLRRTLGAKSPRMVRIYGEARESTDFPVLGGNLRSTRSMHDDLQCDPELQAVALHRLIRQRGRPHAEEIMQIEESFRKNPSRVDCRLLKKYSAVLHQACVEELQGYEVVFTTCAVAGSSRIVKALRDRVYQVIIDESAMSPEPHSLVPIIATKAKQVVLIGDHCQLRSVIKCRAAADLGLKQSLFERLYNVKSTKKIFLNKQYRMHPQICMFPSHEFYKGQVQTGKDGLWSKGVLPFWPDLDQSYTYQTVFQKVPEKVLRKVPHILVDVRGEEDTLTVTTDEGNEGSKSNQLEADKVVEIFTFLTRVCGVKPCDVKVLTQYKAQRNLIENKLNKHGGQNGLTSCVSTVVNSQGDECNYVILSTVRSLPSYKIEPNPTHGWSRQNLGFITDRNQVNVALTRARKGLIIVGNKQLLSCDDVWRHLVDRYEELGCVRQDKEFPPPPPRQSNNSRGAKLRP